MKIYKTKKGASVDYQNDIFALEISDWDAFINDENLYQKILTKIDGLKPDAQEQALLSDILPPIGSQEIWASGVTYLRSKIGRQEESKAAGGGDFYGRVYEADRPELFFKATAYRTVGHGEKVKIRKDSTWDVPEPELTLCISSSGKIIGYTVGNDMSSRSIEGENPLYLPQAKTYDASAAIGPCIYVAEVPLPDSTQIRMKILRKGALMFEGGIEISQMKRKPEELVTYLFRELSFPNGCFLMTGTGIVPPNDFTLKSGDEISITIEPIGTLVNTVN